METHKETIPLDHGRFYCKRSNDFSCWICTANETCNDWRQHELTSCHIRTLEQFNLIFTKSTNGIVCKLCGVSFCREALRTHANWHKIVPWYKPTNLYKTFFRNHVIEWESEFYCHPCKQFFSEWSTAYIHINDNSHQYLLDTQPAVNDFASWTATAVPYDILVSEGFLSNIRTQLVKCTICNCWNINLKNVPEHVKGQQHLHMKIKFLQGLKLLKSEKSVQHLATSAIEESARKLEAAYPENGKNALESCENIACIYIVEQGRNKFFCEICDLELFSRKSVDFHLKETCHVDSLKKYGCEQIWLKEQDYIYHCKCCDCLVLGMKNVHQHVRGVRHKDSLSKLRSSSVKDEVYWNNSIPFKDKAATTSESINKPGSQFLSNDHISKLNSGELLCNLCNILVLNPTNVHNHTSEKTHVFGVKQLAENITFKGGNDYHCKCCDCNIPGIDNVYGHLNGYRHANSLKALDQIRPKPDIKNYDQPGNLKQPKSAIKTSSVKNDSMLPIDDIERQNNTNSHYKQCDDINSDEFNIEKHLTGPNRVFDEEKSCGNISFKDSNNYHCKSCDCTISGINNLYVHLKSISHAESLSALEQQVATVNYKNSDEVQVSKQPKSAIKTSSVKNDSMFPIDDIEKQNNTKSHYKQCDDTNSDEFNIQKHLTGPNRVFDEGKSCGNISSKDSNNYHCKSCNCMIPGLDDMYVDIKGNRHAKFLSNMELTDEKTNKKNPVKVEASKQPESSTQIHSSKNDAMLPRDHIERRNSKQLQCRLCNEVILCDSNVQKHVTSKTHVLKAQQLSENISFVVANNYQCKCCNCMIPGIENIYRHINGIRHAISQKGAFDNFEKHKKTAICNNFTEVKVPEQPEEIAKSADDISFYDHISKLNRAASYCKICNCRISASSNVSDHIAGKRHTELLKMYADAITTMECDEHYCKYCKYAVYGIDKVYLHLQETRHKTLANKVYEKRRQKSAISFDYIASQAELETNMKQCKLKSAISEVPSSPEHPIPCQFCGVSLSSTTDRHSHLAIHIGAELSLPEEPADPEETKEYVPAAEQTTQNSNLSQQTAKLDDSEATEVANHVDKVSLNSIQSNGTRISANHTDSSNLASAEYVAKKSTTNPETNRHSTEKSSMQSTVQLLNRENDFIHDMRDKLRDTELGMKLCLIKEMKNIYCLVCTKEVPESVQNYFKHLSSPDHREYLEKMKKDHALFELVPGQFSEFDLVCQYMEDVSERFVRCHACDIDVDNTDINIRVHISEERHEQSRKKMHLRAKQNFEDIESLLHFDWYSVHKYWCVPCSEYFESELSFAKHLRSSGHAIVTRKSKNSGREIMRDFCSPCGLLWFGFRCTYANHCESTAHKEVILKRDHESQELSGFVKIILAQIELYVDYMIKEFDRLSVTKRDEEETVIRGLEMTVKSKFSNAKAVLVGSKALGFRTGDSDVEIFLDCSNMYNRVKSSECETRNLMIAVHKCLCNDPQIWDVNKMFTGCRTLTFKARHLETGLTCEISFENGFAVENTMLIKYFNDLFPPCRKLTMFLYQWLSLTGLAEPKGISNDALYWYLIFYLQKESLLPSVGSLIAIKHHSHPITDREVVVSFDFSRNKVKNSNLSIRELLINFFTFCEKFDYRYDVASPLLGQEVKKRTFANPQNLPKEMELYMDYMNNLNDPRLFKIDSAMCIQDPLRLQRNLTEDVSKAYLSRFRTCCLKSLDALQ